MTERAFGLQRKPLPLISKRSLPGICGSKKAVGELGITG